MPFRNLHIADEDLLRAADGELSHKKAAEVQQHLSSCWSCRARRNELERSITDFVRAHHVESDSIPRNYEGPRALLKARLSEISSQDSLQRDFSFFSTRPWIAPAVAVALVVLSLAIYLVPKYVLPFVSRSAKHYRDLAVPDPALTPGLVAVTDRTRVCENYADENPVIPEAIALQVFRRYGISSPGRNYELDYLITPRLGGAVDARNLWPQPYNRDGWNAHTKDALEDKLYRLVCSGQVSLQTAQQEIASDWIGSYQKHFKTAEPLRAHAYFTIDRPWASSAE